MKLASLAGIALMFTLSQAALAEPGAGEEAKAERQKQQMLRQLENSLGRKTDGPVVFALYLIPAQNPQQPQNRPGQSNVEVRVQVAEGRKAAAEAVYAFLESGAGWNAAPAQGERPMNATTEGSRSFRYLKSFKPEDATEVEKYVSDAETALKQEIQVASQQAQAYQQFLQQTQGRNGGYGIPRPSMPRPNIPRPGM